MNNEDFAIYLVALVFLFAFYFWLTYVMVSDAYTNNVTSSTAVTQCLPGQCPTDQSTGEKICPDDVNQRYAYNITTQTCNFPGLCQGILPYAINSDGSSNITGICQNNPLTGEVLDCRCDNILTCPEYILSSFSAITGNPFSINTNTQFAQNLIETYGGTGGIIEKPNAEFCQVPLSWLTRSTPGCVGVGGDTDFELAKNCMDLNPCLQGVLAYIIQDVNDANFDILNQIPVGCVRAKYLDNNIDKCDIQNGYLPFYDKLTDSITCRLVCPNGFEARYNGGIQPGYVGPDNFGCYPSCDNLKYDNTTNGFVCS